MVVAASGVCAAEVRYPDNPSVGRSDIFVSFDGVHAYARDGFQKRWTALKGEHTYDPVIHDEVLLVGSSRGLYALRTGDGSLLWHIEAGNEIFTPVVVGNIAYAGSRNGTLYAIDARNGREKWRRTFPGWVYSPAFIDNLLITGGQNAMLWALDPSSGEPRWSRELPGELVYRTVAGAPATVLAMTFSADLIAFDALSGTQQWRLLTPTANTTPYVSETDVLLPGLDGNLRKVNVGTGSIDWGTKLHGRLSFPRFVSKGVVMVRNDEGDIFFLNRKTGMVTGRSRVSGDAVGAPYLHHGSVFQFFQNSGQLSIVAATEISVDSSTEK